MLELYREVPNPLTGAIHLVSYGKRLGSLHGTLASAPHQTKDFLQLKRFQAQKYSSTYVYDYPVVLGQVLAEVWSSFDGCPSVSSSSHTLVEGKVRDPDAGKKLLECKELCLNSAGELVHVDRPPCLNKVARLLGLLTIY